MKTVFDKQTRDELAARINTLNESSKPGWGKMNVYQMIKHCIMWDEMLLGKRQYRQSLLGKVFGKFALKDILKDKPMKPNLPTVPSFKISGNGDVTTAKAEWIDLIQKHDLQKCKELVHPFFGRLTPEQAGKIAFKHIDHHLRQFTS
ncbi:MAG: DUF1569 domain-containing protein [Bacteroidota bacterium]|nr:DUF1569 domain-containing protein [Bacteroidota bacterium]